MFKRDFATLIGAASKLEKVADGVEKAFDFATGAFEAVEPHVYEFVETIRTNAETLRAEAEAKNSGWGETVDPVEKTNPSTTREDKVAHIQKNLKVFGIKDSKWTNPAMVSMIPDSIVDATYRAFGGK